MKGVIILTVLLFSFVVATWADGYDSRYDSIDLDKILSNDRILSNYIKCLMSKAPCTREGRTLREDLPEAIETNCGKCNKSQRKMIRKACKHIKDKKPADWKILEDIYDPKGIHRDSFNKFLDTPE